MGYCLIYKCTKCGNKMRTDVNHRYAVFAGEFRQYKCARCNEIIHLQADAENGKRISYGILVDTQCPKCGKTTVLTPWKPDLGCPKCGSVFACNPDHGVLSD